MTDETGTDLLREALKTRNAKLNLVLVIRDLGWSDVVFYRFLDGGDITPEQKHGLCDYLWNGSIVWDPVTDRLTHKRPEAKPVSGFLPQLDPNILPKYKMGPAPTRAPSTAPLTEKKKRPGWLSDLGW